MSFSSIFETVSGISLAVQWLGLRSVTARAPGSIHGWGTKIPKQAAWPKKKKGKKQSL